MIYSFKIVDINSYCRIDFRNIYFIDLFNRLNQSIVKSNLYKIPFVKKKKISMN